MFGYKVSNVISCFLGGIKYLCDYQFLMFDFSEEFFFDDLFKRLNQLHLKIFNLSFDLSLHIVDLRMSIFDANLVFFKSSFDLIESGINLFLVNSCGVQDFPNHSFVFVDCIILEAQGHRNKQVVESLFFAFSKKLKNKNNNSLITQTSLKFCFAVIVSLFGSD